MGFYGWGSNASGELPNQYPTSPSSSSSKVSNAKYVPVFQPRELFPNSERKLLSIAAGESHTLALSSCGSIFSYGKGPALGRDNVDGDNKVKGLDHETIIAVAAGSITSFAITAQGKAYQWGLIHRSEKMEIGQSDFDFGELEINNSATMDALATSGALVGLAADQQTFLVPADTEARESSGMAGGGSEAPRVLEDILRQSNDSFMAANDDADDEYHRELEALGYGIEEVEQKMQSRGREYHGMLRMGCLRRPQLTPILIKTPDRIKIASIAAGYAHTMLLTTTGQLYGCGYNDRGQLGLGHRINTSKFKYVAFLEGKKVLQVACGQQHTVLLVLPREMDHDGGTPVAATPATPTPFIGGDVYVFGNGALGQLGLGIRGTSKGRLWPTRVPFLHTKYPLGIVDVAAGGYFTIVTTHHGRVYGFGHSEYNQMATVGDNVDSYHYYVPRPIAIKKDPGLRSDDKAGQDDKKDDDAYIVRCHCGFNFSVAIDNEGELYSWGWNESGVLGRGEGYFSSSAERVDKLGQAETGRVVIAVAAGTKHVVALTAPHGDPWALTNLHLLPCNNRDATVNPPPPHADMFIVIDTDSSSVSAEFPCHTLMLSARSTYLRGYLRACGHGREHKSLLRVTLPSIHATELTVPSLLEYLYLDRVTLPVHKRHKLRALAEDLHLHPLVSLCAVSSIGYHLSTPLLPSSFGIDMSSLIDDKNSADVLVTLAPSLTDPPVGKIYAHKAILCKIPYFHALFTNHFQDSVEDQEGVSTVHLISEGLDHHDFSMFLQYIYTGSFYPGVAGAVGADAGESVADVNYMGLLVLSDRLQMTSLASLCERQLSVHLNDYPENTINVLEFARTYNFARLEAQCMEALPVKG